MEQSTELGYAGYPVTDAAAVSEGGHRDWQNLAALPMTKLRTEFLHFRNIYNEWITRSVRDPAQLETMLVRNGLSRQCANPNYWYNRIYRDEIFDPQVSDPATFHAIRQRFVREVHKVETVLRSPDLDDFPYGPPSPNDRWREALWGIGMLFAEKELTLKETRKSKEEWLATPEFMRGPLILPPVSPVTPLLEAVANTPGMQRRLAQFVRRMDAQQRGLGESHNGNKAVVQYGPMRSWFFNAKAKENPRLPYDLINLDLQMTLLIGDFIDGIFQHELEHQEKSNFYPESLLKHRRLAKEAEAELERLTEEGKGITITREGVENFDKGSETEKLVKQVIRHNFLFSLLHPVWNCAEDNMCDQGVANSGNPKRRKKSALPYDMAHSSNMGTLIARGVGPRLLGFAPDAERVELERNEAAGKAPQGPAPGNEEAQAALRQLQHIQSAILFAFYIRNQLTEDSPAGWKALGIDVGAVEDARNPGLSHEEAYMEMRKLCDRIAESQPLPRDQARLSGRRFRELSDRLCEQRNRYIDELFERFVDKTVEKILQEFEKQSLDQQVEQLRQQLDQAGKRGKDIEAKVKPNGKGDGNGKPGEGQGEGGQGEGGQGGGEGKEEDMSIPTDSRMDDKPGQHNGKDISEKDGSGARTWEEALNAGEIEVGEHDERDAQNAEKGGKAEGKGIRHTKGGTPLDRIEFGDGRSYLQLRDDPNYQAAVEYIAERLRAISERFPAMVLRHEEDASLLPTEAAHIGDLAGRIDKEALWNLAIAERTGDISLDTLRVFQDDVEVPFASPGDIMLNIDLSGSMNKGRGSRSEAAVKSAALLYDASQRAGFGGYMNVWGNDFPTIIAAPGVPEETVIATLDRLVQLAVTGKEIEGLQKGTDFDSAFASSLAQLSLERDEQTLRPRTVDEEFILPPRRMPRGPVLSLYLSDGEIGTAPKLDRSFDQVTGLTVDTCYTEGNPASMVGFVEKIPDPFGGHVHVDISKAPRIPQTLVQWVESRYQRILDGAQANRHEWLTQEKLERQMEDALHDYLHENKGNFSLKSKTGDDFTKNAQKQIGKLKETLPHTHIMGGSARLSGLAAPPESQGLWRTG